MKRIPILYLIDKMALGGTERQLMNLLTHLGRDRFEPHLATIRPSSTPLDGLDVPKVFLGLTSFRSPQAVQQVRRLAAYVRQQRIALVQAFFPDSFLLGAMLRGMTPVRLIGSFRDMGFWRPNGLAGLKLRLSEPFCAGFIANSKAVRDHYLKADRLPAEKIQVIYNGIVADQLTPVAGKSPGPVVGIVGNYTRPVKRMTDFVLAARQVLDRRPEARFLVVGDGPLMSEMKQMAERLGLGEAVRFTGRVASPQEFIRQMKLGVITSESEGLCNAILEYMACGLPVVATAAGGNGELVGDGENGYLVPVGDADRLAERVVRLLDDPALCRQMGEKSRQTVLERFTIDRMVRAHEDYYGNLLTPGASIEAARAEKG